MGQKQVAWVLDYKDVAGKRRLKTFETRRAAEQWSVTALHEVRQGTHTPTRASITVAEGWKLWLAAGEADGLEHGTIQGRLDMLRLHVNPFIGMMRLSALTAPGIYEFDDKLRKAGRSLAMRRKVLSCLKTMLTFCQGQGRVAQNVAKAVRIKSDDQRDVAPVRAGVDFPDRDELRTILDKAEGRWRPLVITAIFTGMRASELRGLPWCNVDLDNAVIHVRQRADKWGTIGRPKSRAGNRDIPLTPMVVNALRQWRDECPKGDLGLVFPNTAGNVLNHQNLVSRFWEPLQVATGMSVKGARANTASTPFATPLRACSSLIWAGRRSGYRPCWVTRPSP